MTNYINKNEIKYNKIDYNVTNLYNNKELIIYHNHNNKQIINEELSQLILNNITECNICVQWQIKSNIKKTACNHEFCVECFEKIIKNKKICPFCRRELL